MPLRKVRRKNKGAFSISNENREIYHTVYGLTHPEKASDTAWTVYMVRAGNGALYTGIAKDVTKRIAVHNQGKGSKSLRALGLPVKVVYQEKVGAYGAALKREHQIKKLTKKAKEELAVGKGGSASGI